MNPWIESFLETFFPNQCLLCSAPHPENLCDQCLMTIPQIPTVLTSSDNQLFRIPFTTKSEQLPKGSALQACLVASEFKDTSLRHLIHGFKYKNLPQLSYPLSRILLQSLSHHIIPTNQTPFLCPVPLHPNRHKFRGYNQAELLADHLSKDLHFPLYTDLVRIKHTRQQMRNQHRTDRIQNMTDAFQAKPTPSTNRPIILVDDVTTTLSTLEESAKALSQAGFKEIYAVVIAH